MSQIYFAVHENTYKLKSVNLYRNKIWKPKAYYPFTSNIFRAELSRRRVCAHRQTLLGSPEKVLYKRVVCDFRPTYTFPAKLHCISDFN